jgi:hypothetical protein
MKDELEPERICLPDECCNRIAFLVIDAVSSQIGRVNVVDGLRQISLQFRNNVVEQTSGERVRGFLLQHPISSYLIPEFLPTFRANHVAMLPHVLTQTRQLGYSEL